MTSKEKIWNQHQQFLQDKIDVYQDLISGLTTDAQNDAKGSAGDKHETALSMMHLEQEKLTIKLREVLEQKKLLNTIDFTKNHSKVGVGSLVQVNQLWLYVSSALPKIEMDGKTIFSISPQSPLGSQIMGKEKGHSFELNNVQYTINDIS